MGELFNITHDAGNLDEYDSTVIDGGDLSAHADAAMGGSHGLKCVIDDTTGIYGQVTQGWPVSNQLRYRFYVDPNGYTANSWTILNILRSNPGSLRYVALRKVPAYTLVFWGHFDGGSANFGMEITDAPHYVECHIERASSDVAEDGRVRFWVDGALVKTWADLDNWDVVDGLSSFESGAVLVVANTAGTIYLDEFKANDDGSEIGAIADANGISGMAMGMKVVRT